MIRVFHSQKLSLLAAVLFCFLTSQTRASMVFDNGGPSGISGVVSDLGTTPDPSLAGLVISIPNGMDITLSNVQWHGHYTGGTQPMDDFTVAFYQTLSSTGDPTATISNSFPFPLVYNIGVTAGTSLDLASATGDTVGGQPQFEYSATLPGGVNDVLLQNQNYLVSIYNNTSDADAWFWDESVDTTLGNYFAINPAQPVWQLVTDSVQLTFSLNDAEAPPMPGVPEPSSLALLGFAALFGAFYYRRRSVLA